MRNSEKIFNEIKENVVLFGRVFLSIGYRDEWYVIMKGKGVYEVYERDSFDRWYSEPSFIGKMMDAAKYIHRSESIFRLRKEEM